MGSGCRLPFSSLGRTHAASDHAILQFKHLVVLINDQSSPDAVISQQLDHCEPLLLHLEDR